MTYLEKFLEGILEELHCRFDGLSLERARTEARALLEATLLDLDEVLETFVDELRACHRCGAGRHECDMEEVEHPRGNFHLCEHCS